MSDLFEDDEDAVVEVGEDFVEDDREVDVDAEIIETASNGLDARRRLENLLDEKRLRDELDDFGGY